MSRPQSQPQNLTSASTSAAPCWIDHDGRRYPIAPPPPRPSRQQLRHTRRQLAKWLDRHEQYEWHEKAWELDEDPWATVEIHRLIVERQADHWRHYLHLADAWLRVHRPEPALDACQRAHELVPECTETAQLLVECLRLLGHDWRDFPWVERPEVLELDGHTSELGLDALPAGGWLDSIELWFEISLGRVCLFDCDELAKHLSSDPRFVVDEFEGDLLVKRWER